MLRDLFGDWEETILWSCLQGVMGEVCTNGSGDAAMAILGDFAFCAGAPDPGFLKGELRGRRQEFIILVPQHKGWAELIEECFGDRARKVTRYATRKERDVFDLRKLERVASKLPEGYELRFLGEAEYEMCKKSDWAADLVSQFRDYDAYRRLGLGVVAVKEGQLAAGASSYSRYETGIEIEIDTKEEHRRKGLAYACGARLILECLKRGLYPSWDAQNLWSLALAEKLGYHFSHEYEAYEITG